MTVTELKEAIDKMYGFHRYDDVLKLHQVVLDDISLWFTSAQIEAFDEEILNNTIAKKIVSQLKNGDYPKEIYVN